MDEYKFVNVTKLVAALTYTANKIRAKLGISSKLVFDLEGETGFGDPVDDIQVGITPSGSIELNANGIYDVTEKASAVVAVPQPTGSVEITANGTYDVTEKASAIVNVPSGGITPSGTKEITITENGTTTEDVTNYASAKITVDVQSGGGGNDFAEFVARTPTTYSRSDITKIGKATFSEYSALTSAIFPNVTEIGEKAFYNCGNLSTLQLHALTKISGASAFYNVPASLAFPALTTVPGLNTFNSTKCPVIDLGTGIQWIASSMFANSSLLSALVLRSTTLAALAHINAFNSTPFASGKAGGALYVPSALISTYQSATNWSTILGYANNQILPIEGSIYETQYADGTPIV